MLSLYALQVKDTLSKNVAPGGEREDFYGYTYVLIIPLWRSERGEHAAYPDCMIKLRDPLKVNMYRWALSSGIIA